jgi:hypothetical protein
MAAFISGVMTKFFENDKEEKLLFKIWEKNTHLVLNIFFLLEKKDRRE